MSRRAETRAGCAPRLDAGGVSDASPDSCPPGLRATGHLDSGPCSGASSSSMSDATHDDATSGAAVTVRDAARHTAQGTVPLRSHPPLCASICGDNPPRPRRTTLEPPPCFGSTRPGRPRDTAMFLGPPRPLVHWRQGWPSWSRPAAPAPPGRPDSLLPHPLTTPSWAPPLDSLLGVPTPS